MRQDQLADQEVEFLQPVGIDAEPAFTRMHVWGIHGADDFVVALRIGSETVERMPANPITGAARETTDAMRIRARRSMPSDALRDSKGSAIGWFAYAGLEQDHCRAVAAREAAL